MCGWDNNNMSAIESINENKTTIIIIVFSISLTLYISLMWMWYHNPYNYEHIGTTIGMSMIMFDFIVMLPLLITTGINEDDGDWEPVLIIGFFIFLIGIIIAETVK